MTGNLGNRGFLENDSDDDGLFPIHGIAIGPNDITRGHLSGERKLWKPSVLEEAAHTLQGKEIVANHENKDVYEVVGEVEETKFDEDRGVLYRGKIDDEELANKIDNGWLEVSPRILHSAEHDERNGVKIPREIREFDNLSVVVRGASPSNSVELGEPEELSVEELQEAFDEYDTESEYHYPLSEEDFNSLTEELEEGFDFKDWMYDNPEGAEGAAEKFDCNGAHKREVDGEEVWMPCENPNTFLRAIDEEDEMAKDYKKKEMNYDSEMKKIASQMASYSELTKQECLGILDTINPSSDSDIDSVAKMLSKAYGVDSESLKYDLSLSLDEYSELQESEGDLREAAAIVASRWEVSTGDALQIISSITPGEGGDLRILASKIAEREDFEGIDVTDIMSALDDLRSEDADEVQQSRLERIYR